jgi:integrase
MKLKLTQTAIQRLPAPHPTGKQKLVWDTDLKGFGVLVSGVTNSKTYVVQRDVNGKTRRITVGAANVLDVSEARKRAELILADLYRGIDPKAGRKTTLRSVLEDYLETNKKLRPASVADYRAGVERYLKDWLDRPLKDITGDDVAQRHLEIASEIKAAGRYSGAATANSVMRGFRVLWNFAAESDSTLPVNPVRRLKRQWFKVERRTRHLNEAQLPIFYKAVCGLPSPIHRDFLLVLLFTGLRREEAASLTWDAIDFGAKTLRIEANKAKSGRELILPLTDFLFDLFVARRQLGRDRYIFPSNSKAGYLAEPKYPLNLIELATGIHISCHDIRRTFATVAETCEVGPLMQKKLLNHATGADVTMGYIQLSVEHLRAPAQKICDRIKTLCQFEPITGDNVRKISG